jgi:hypothetical protein
MDDEMIFRLVDMDCPASVELRLVEHGTRTLRVARRGIEQDHSSPGCYSQSGPEIGERFRRQPLGGNVGGRTLERPTDAQRVVAETRAGACGSFLETQVDRCGQTIRHNGPGVGVHVHSANPEPK